MWATDIATTTSHPDFQEPPKLGIEGSQGSEPATQIKGSEWGGRERWEAFLYSHFPSIWSLSI